MTDARTVTVRDQAGHARALALVQRIRYGPGVPAYDVRVEPHADKITSQQRALLFALCRDIARALPFPGGGSANATAWKDFLVGLYRGERMVREGSVVVIVGGSISQATKREAADLIEFVQAYGATRDVRFSAPARFEDGGR